MTSAPNHLRPSSGNNPFDGAKNDFLFVLIEKFPGVKKIRTLQNTNVIHMKIIQLRYIRINCTF